MTIVINLFGAPGSGKSTLAAGLFYHLKLQGYNVEMAAEWIKAKVFEDTPYPFKDQLYTFAKQHKKIREMNNKVDYIICDSPLVQGLVYNSCEPKIFNDMVLEYFNQYNNLNFLLKRTHVYQTSGRLQTEQESNNIAEQIESKLKEYNITYKVLPTNSAIQNIITILGKSCK